MRVEVIMPQMGESIVEGTIVEWLKKVGDAVARDEDIFTLSTDKVDAEVPAPQAGVLTEILFEPGDTVEVGTVVAWLETDAEAAKSAPAKTEAAAPAKAAEPAKAATPAKAEAPPAKAEARSAAPEADPGTPIGERSVDELRRQRSTPLVRRIAEEHGISNLAAIEGTGVSGRVTKKDILAFIEQGGASSPAATASAPKAAAARPAAQGAPGPGEHPMYVRVHRVHVYAEDRVEPMTRMRASIAENMMQARRGTAHCHTVWEADVTPLVRARKALRAEFEERGVKLTFTAFFVAAVIDGLRAFPLMNSAIDGDSIVYRGNVNVGVAAAIDEGLIVPVLKGADGLNLFGIARGINELAEKARTKKLMPQDVADGTFTISNAGIWGSLFGVPILVQPQVGILGIGGVKKRVVADEDDNIRVRSMVNMCLTFDHRLIDGATADGFMKHVTTRLSTWSVE